MASSKDRQRAMARAKLDRQMARRAAKLRRRRQLQAGIGAAAALVLIVAGAFWLGGAFDKDGPADDPAAAADDCVWSTQDTQTNSNLKDVGQPPTTGVPKTGTRPLTITTNQGAPITVSLDLAAAPCGAADLTYLAQQKFFDNTDCHEITAEGALRCGDPSGTGLGGPTYSVYNENVPAKADPAPSASAGAAGAPKAAPLYPKGSVALIGNPPGTNGSQFLIFFKDASPATPQYSIVGTVTGGLDTLTKISKVPTVDNGQGSKIKPKDKITVKSLTVGDVAGGAAAPAAAPSASDKS